MQVLADLGVPWAGISAIESTLLARTTDLARKYGKVNLEAILRKHPELAVWVTSCKEKFTSGTLDEAVATSLIKCGVRMPTRRAS
jgi:hypothetical protein